MESGEGQLLEVPRRSSSSGSDMAQQLLTEESGVTKPFSQLRTSVSSFGIEAGQEEEKESLQRF